MFGGLFGQSKGIPLDLQNSAPKGISTGAIYAKNEKARGLAARLLIITDNIRGTAPNKSND